MAVAFDTFACVFDQSTLTSRLVTQDAPSLQLLSKLMQRQYLHRHKKLKKGPLASAAGASEHECVSRC